MKQDEIQTPDIYFAAYLRVAGVSFLRKTNLEGRIYFIFEKPEIFTDLKSQYYNRIASVPALTYADEIKNFKAMLYDRD
jgi:hypothetical protein